jgi:hypothetical protein
MLDCIGAENVLVTIISIAKKNHITRKPFKRNELFPRIYALLLLLAYRTS